MNLKVKLFAVKQALLGKVRMDETSHSGGNDYWGMGSIGTYNPDELVGRKGLGIYSKMERTDAQVKNTFHLKKHARLSTPWHIIPASEDAIDVEKAEFTETVFEEMDKSVDQFLYKCYNALRDGYSITEKNYKVLEKGEFSGKIGFKSLKTRKAKNYTFQTDDHGNLTALLESRAGSGTKEELDPRKFIIFSYNADDDDGGSLYGVSDFRAAYRYWFSNDIVQRYWNIFLEKFASPTRYGLYPSGASKAKQTQLYNLLKSMQANSVVVLPENLVAEGKGEMKGIGMLEAARKADASYKLSMDFNNKMIARSMLVGSLIQDEGDTHGSYALGKKHFDIFMFVLNWLGKLTEEEIMHEQIIKPLIDLNYPDTENYPRFQFESLQQEDKKNTAEVIKVLVGAGIINPDEDWVREYLSIPAKEEGVVLPAPAGTVPKEAFTFSTYARAKGLLNRAPTTYERKVDFVAVSGTMEGLQEDAVERTTEAFRKISDSVIKQVKMKKIIANKDYTKIKDVLVNVGDVKKIAYETMTTGYMDGKMQVKNEVERAGAEVPRRYAAAILEEAVEPTEALEFFKKKIPMTKAEYSALSRKYKEKAFAIAGTEQDRILKDARQLLEDALQYGWAETKFEHKFNEKMEQYIGGAPGQLKDGKLMEPYHIETVYRTNLSEAYNSGRRAMMEDPSIKAQVPAWEYSAIMDPRTTDFCRAMDKKVYLSTDPIWEQNYPPNHYNCRSIVVGIVAETEKYEVSKPVDEKPQEGFYTQGSE